MLSSQWIAGVAAVIKVCLAPVLFRMAIAALLSIASCMYIIQLVATVALLRGIFVLLVYMTAVAVQLYVLFTQSEVRLVVIKHRAPPAAFGMAISTLLAEGPLVDVIFSVARHADCRSVPIFFPLNMTGFTADNRVCALKRIICGVMVKGLAPQLDDICVAAFMVCMTVAAFGFPCLRTSMKTLPVDDVCIDFFMAV